MTKDFPYYKCVQLFQTRVYVLDEFTQPKMDFAAPMMDQRRWHCFYDEQCF